MDLGPHGEQIAQSDVVSEKCLTKRLLRRSERDLGSHRDSVAPRTSHSGRTPVS